MKKFKRMLAVYTEHNAYIDIHDSTIYNSVCYN